MMLTTILTLTLTAQSASIDPSPGVKTRLAVMPFKSVGTSDGFVEGLTETFATEVANTEVFDVVSPRQVAAVLAYEKRKELLGSCVEDDCYLQVARLVKADHLIGGSVAQVDQRLVLNVVLIDATKGKALARRKSTRPSAAGLLADIKSTAIVLLQPLLGARQGFLKVAVNVPDAELVIDDRRRAQASGQPVPLAAGPHILRVDRDGFYSASADVFVKPGRVSFERIDLIPAQATVEAYERKATWMRVGAWTTAALAVGSAVASGLFYAQATDNKEFTDRFGAALSAERLSLGGYDRYQEERDAFDTNQGLYLGFLIGALVSGAAATYLFVAGDPPGRYEDMAVAPGDGSLADP